MGSFVHMGLPLWRARPARSPRVRAITFTSYICCIYTTKFGQYWTLSCLADLSVSCCLICSFCSSDRGFALDFLQIPPRGGHPCPLLTVPTAKSVADFHRQVIAHVGHTRKKHHSSKIFFDEWCFFVKR